MDLPTYTNIWRIEKRLYKLYDFRLPMPLPVGQIAVFTAIAAPYVLVLTIVGLPFSHTLLWLYVLPPGLLAWLATRPVIESKRLPELLASQLRYLGEPRTWCRMAPLAEPDEVTAICQVWRRDPPELELAAAARSRAALVAANEPAAIGPAPEPATIETAGVIEAEPAGVADAAGVPGLSALALSTGAPGSLADGTGGTEPAGRWPGCRGPDPGRRCWPGR